jgi:hypothetical protein
MAVEFDVWGNGDGVIKATAATKTFVDDGDAPYGFDRHLLRVTAASARAAQAIYRASK